MAVKYPHIEVKLIGQDGNAFAILGRVLSAMRNAKLPTEEIDRFKEAAMASNYDNLLVTVMEWVTVR